MNPALYEPAQHGQLWPLMTRIIIGEVGRRAQGAEPGRDARLIQINALCVLLAVVFVLCSAAQRAVVVPACNSARMWLEVHVLAGPVQRGLAMHRFRGAWGVPRVRVFFMVFPPTKRDTSPVYHAYASYFRP